MELDLATLIFAQRTILTSKSTWAIHLRADSSPQGGRDWFLSEYDLVKMAGQISHKHVTWLLQRQQLSIVKRILPASILGQRASSTVHKAQQLVHALSLESESVQFSIQRTFSLLSDFGAEGGMINVPASSIDAFSHHHSHSAPDADFSDAAVDTGLQSALHRLFGKAMPIADCDHSIHHVPCLISSFMNCNHVSFSQAEADLPAPCFWSTSNQSQWRMEMLMFLWRRPVPDPSNGKVVEDKDSDLDQTQTRRNKHTTH